MSTDTNIPCLNCDGTGFIEYYDDDYFDDIYMVLIEGTLEHRQYSCPVCDGTGSFLDALKKSNTRQHQESALATKLRAVLSI